MLRIWLFGGARFSVADSDVVVPKGAPSQRLLGYLALTAGREITKDQAANHIWGAGKVGDNFRRALSDLRKAFSDAGIEPDRYIRSVEGRAGHLGTIWLVSGAWVDALEFRRLWERNPSEALKLARGALLGELRDPGPWLSVRRDQYRRMVADGYARVATEAWATGDRAHAIILAELRHEMLPEDADAIAALMVFLAQDGQREAAIELGQRFLREHGDTTLVRELIERARRREIATVPHQAVEGLAEQRGFEEAREDPEVAHRSAPAVADAAPEPPRPPGPEPPGPGRWAWSAAAVLGAVASAVVAVALIRSGGDTTTVASAPDACDAAAVTELSAADRQALGVTAPRTSAPRVDAEIITRSRPRAIAAASDGVWLTQSTDGSVWRIDPRIDKPVGEPFPVGGTPFSLAVADQAIWVTRDDGVLVELDRSTGRIERQVKYGPSSAEVALGNRAVWVNIYDGNHRGDVARIDPCSGSVHYMHVGDGANTVLYAYGAVWASDSRSRELHRLDPVTGDVQDVSLDVTDPQDIGAGAGYIWIAHYGPKRLTRVDPTSLERVGKPIPIGAGAAGVSVGAGAVWIPNYEGDSVTRVDLDTLKSDPNAVRVGDSPTDLAIGNGRLWVTNNDAEPPTVTEIIP